MVASLQGAILERRVTSLRYFGRNRGEATTRHVEPFRLAFANGAWYLVAFCRLRQAERAFRLDRIDDLHVETEHFRSRPAINHQETSGVEVIVRFTPSSSRWVSERQHWSFVRAEQIGDELIASYRPRNIDAIASWILGWGSDAEVLAPPDLRERLREESRRVLESLT